MSRYGFVMIAFSASLLAIAGTSLRPVSVAAAQDPAPNSAAFYSTRVDPILQANCARCHGGINHRGGLSIDTHESLLKGGKSGPAVVPGHPEQSLLIKLVHQDGLTEDQRAMPPRTRLSDADIATLEQWIRAGAIVSAKP